MNGETGSVHPMDVGAVGVLLGVLTNLLPVIASLLTIIWMLIRIWETRTVQKWITRPKKKGRKKTSRPVPLGDDPADP